MNNQEYFDFIASKDKKLILLLYAHDSKPEKVIFYLNYSKKAAVLKRNCHDEIALSDISENILEICRNNKKISVQELSQQKDEKDTKIVYAYEANIVFNIGNNEPDISQDNQSQLNKSSLHEPKLRLLLKRNSPALSPYIKEYFKPLEDFMIAEGAFGKLYIFMKCINGEPENPVIYYDNGDHAVFMRSPDNCIILDYIHKDIKQFFFKSCKVIIVETEGENVVKKYSTPVIRV